MIDDAPAIDWSQATSAWRLQAIDGRVFPVAEKPLGSDSVRYVCESITAGHPIATTRPRADDARGHLETIRAEAEERLGVPVRLLQPGDAGGRERRTLPVAVAPSVEIERPDHLGPDRCHSDNDGDCNWAMCPQTRDGEPAKSGRSCPIYNWHNDER